MDNKQCDRCGIESEFHMGAEAKGRHATLCSDCCMQFIAFLGSIGQIKESDFIDYATNTNAPKKTNPQV